MSKEYTINMLTLLDTGSYRRNFEGDKYKHEPPNFRSTLFEVYNKLSEEDLKTLFNIRSK